MLGALRTTTSRAVVDSWLDKVALVQVDGNAVTLQVGDAQLADCVEHNYLEPIASALTTMLGAPAHVALREVPPTDMGPQTVALFPAERAPVRQGLPLELLPSDADTQEWQDLAPRFNFDNFVVGKANELAAAAAQAVSQAPGQVYNPLFLHGGVGLGKTHLLHAIGQAARQRNPGLRVRYVAAETFIDDTMSAWRSKDGHARSDVRALYRHNVDMLLVDDVQFLQGRTPMQEEFFHLFNALHQSGKQIVLSCDRYPSELQQFHDRLRSRFDWGLVAELTPPDRDLRLAILQRKARDLALPLPYDVALYIADHLRNNIRELEGALTKLTAHARIGQRGIDLALARSVLGPLVELPSRNLTAEVIQRVVAQQFGLKITDLKGQKRHRSIVEPRMMAMYLTRKHTSMSYPEIGRVFGGRDHTTVIHACQKIDWQIKTDASLQSAVQSIETALGK
ncbi:MAG: chromosomal replication initiator protein DnaA [Deltaproteobacteria bacterium]|nr:chromosomal replication initiator protein DnaA [Deltaproteobacteria bacterium]